MAELACVILAAGQSTRFRSKKSKVLHMLAGREVVSYPIAAAKKCGASRILLVRGPAQADLKEYAKAHRVEDVVQRHALGTANAVMAAEKALSKFTGRVLILCGDAPLVRAEGLLEFVAGVERSRAVIGVQTMTLSDPVQYGRIVRDSDGEVAKIVEARDASEKELSICEVNTGIYWVDGAWLFNSLKKVGTNNAKGEFYLTDLIVLARGEGRQITGLHAPLPLDFLGINTRADLALVAQEMRARINTRHMMEGVGLIDGQSTFIDADVRIGIDTEVMPFSFLLGSTKVGKGCVIENGAVLINAVLGNGVRVRAHSMIEDSKILDGAIVGPFARIRPESKVGKNARVGNFVELKKCELKDGAKANHLTYLGDAMVGAKANIGCGTITCNYDGFAKYRTVIGEGAFVGSDTQFVAPVRVGRGATIGAGSTITKDVPADALALSRTEQKNVKGWAIKKRDSLLVTRGSKKRR